MSTISLQEAFDRVVKQLDTLAVALASEIQANTALVARVHSLESRIARVELRR